MCKFYIIQSGGNLMNKSNLLLFFISFLLLLKSSNDFSADLDLEKSGQSELSLEVIKQFIKKNDPILISESTGSKVRRLGKLSEDLVASISSYSIKIWNLSGNLDSKISLVKTFSINQNDKFFLDFAEENFEEGQDFKLNQNYGLELTVEDRYSPSVLAFTLNTLELGVTEPSCFLDLENGEVLVGFNDGSIKLLDSEEIYGWMSDKDHHKKARRGCRGKGRGKGVGNLNYNTYSPIA